MTTPSYDRGATPVTTTTTTGPRRSKGSFLRWLIPLILLLIVAAIILAVILASRSSDDAKKDVKVTSCVPGTGGGKPKASGTITNHSSKTSNYVVKLKFTDGEGNKVSEGAASVGSVDADKSAKWQLTGARSAKGSVKCEITGVARTHVPGQ